MVRLSSLLEAAFGGDPIRGFSSTGGPRSHAVLLAEPLDYPPRPPRGPGPALSGTGERSLASRECCHDLRVNTTRREEAEMADAEGEGPGGQSDPRSRLMEEVADQMDAIEADFGDQYEIGALMTIVEVRQPDGSAGVRVRSNVPPWVGLGMLRVAEKAVESQA
jgi:hypothetical protein